MYIKSIKIKNFKCFNSLNSGKGVSFSVPNGVEEASGLNIFIGENNTGKTALINAFSKLRDTSQIYDEEKYKNRDIEIKIMDSTGKFRLIKNISGSVNIDLNNIGTSNLGFGDIDIVKENRIWTSNLGNNSFSFDDYRNNYSFKRQDIDQYLSARLSSIEKNDTLKRDEFNALVKKIIPDFSTWTIRGNSKSGNFISYKMISGDNFDIDFSLGSGILNIFRIILSFVEDKNIIFIDEPEVFLHPKAQTNLLDILMKEAKNKQIFISTHSPYMFKNVFSSKARLHIFRKTTSNKIEIINAINKNLRLFKWSPSWGEINFFAYNLPTIEFHNELYGYIQEETKNTTESGMENFLQNSGLAKAEKWNRELNGIAQGEKDVTLQTFIRNKIHHPENTTMKSIEYTPRQLDKSIREMIVIVRTLS